MKEDAGREGRERERERGERLLESLHNCSPGGGG